MASPMPPAPAVTSTRKPLMSRSMIAPGCGLKISAGETAARKDKIRRTADVSGNSLKRRGAMAGGDGFSHVGVKPDGVAIRQPLRIGAQIEIDDGTCFQPERADDLHQDRRVRRFIDRKVEALVEFDRARQVGR